MDLHRLPIPRDRLEDICRRHGVKRWALFGGALRGEAGPESDGDVLVEFLPGRTPGMIGFGRMIPELSEIFGRRVDPRTPDDLSISFKQEVMAHARTLHAA
jgi:hypothetical protein